MARFQVHYGEQHKSLFRWVVWDSKQRRVVVGSDAKSAVIACAQTHNGFTPVDGSEQTYGRQVDEADRG